MSRLSICLCWGVLAAGATPAFGQTPAAEPLAATPGGNEVLRPGDVVQLRVWREPDLSGEFKVDESGVVTVPKLGRIHALGFTRDSLKRHLVSSYEAYLRNPSIEVTLLRRVLVLGAVRAPGVYPADPTFTVSEVIALAGGAAPDGKMDKVQVIRGQERLDVALKEGTRLSDTPIRSGDQLFVPQRSWVSRNIGFVVGTTATAAGLIIGLLR